MRQLDWSYLGAFFDGEGSVGLYLYRRNRPHPTICVIPCIQISNSKPFLYEIRKFLESENIHTHPIYQIQFQIGHWDDVKKFIVKILPHTILKTKELELLLLACNLYTKRDVVKNLAEYAKISVELSKFKGHKGQHKKYLKIADEILNH